MTAPSPPPSLRSDTAPATVPWLRPFALALERRRAYGPMHRLVAEAIDEATAALRGALAATARLELKVARDTLLLDGTPLPTTIPIARDIARRLHRRGVAAIVLDAALTPEALAGLLGRLADEPGAVQRAVEAWRGDGIALAPVAFDRLALGGEGSDPAASAAAIDGAVGQAVDRCWRALADAALLPPLEPGAAPAGAATSARTGGATGSAAATGDTTRTSPTGAPLDAAATAGQAAQAIITLAETADLDPRAQALVADRLHELLQRLGPGSFARIVADLASDRDRRLLLDRLADTLPVDVVGECLAIAAASRDHGLSEQLVRLLGKLARTDGDLPAARAEEVVRDTARQLVAEWTLENPNPREHLLLLETISAIDPVIGAGTDGTLTRIEDWRLLAFALETDLDTPAVRTAAVALAEQGYLSHVLAWIRHVGPTPTAYALRNAVLESGAVQRLLADEAIATGEAEAIIGALGAEATELLIDLVAEAPRRAVRRLVLLRLQAIGAAIVPVVETRLPTAEPRLARNLLVLMRDLRVRSPGIVQGALRALADESPLVRAEAVRFLVDVPAACATAVARALRDTVPRIVRLALGAIIDAPADYASAVIDAAVRDDIVAGCLRVAESETFDDRTRAGAVLAAGALGGERVRDRLVALLVVRTRVLRRRTLADPTPPAVAALHVLRRDWHADPAVAETLALAQREARDPKWIAVPVLPTDEERP